MTPTEGALLEFKRRATDHVVQLAQPTRSVQFTAAAAELARALYECREKAYHGDYDLPFMALDVRVRHSFVNQAEEILSGMQPAKDGR